MSAPETPLWALIYFGVEWVLRLVMLAVVPLRRSPAVSQSWLLLIFFLPIPALALYLLVGRPHLSPERHRRMEEMNERLLPTLSHLEHDPLVAEPDFPTAHLPAVQLARHLSDLPTLGGNHAELIGEYEAVFARLCEDIDNAAHSVHMAFYIATLDDSTRPVITALTRAARRGVHCRVLLDAYGAKKDRRALERALDVPGIDLALSFPLTRPRRGLSRFDLRNHRKLVIIDGHIGYTGSQNLTAPRLRRGLENVELVLRLRGPIVLELQYIFVGDWFLETDALHTAPELFPAPRAYGTSVAQGLPSGPEYPVAIQQRLIVTLLHAATDCVTLTTPYFIPDESLLLALQSAAQRGVRVRLIVSETLDHRLVQWAQESWYEELLEEGVEIHRYQGGFLHAKHAVFDGRISLIGSANLDIRSGQLNAEFGLLFYDTAMADALTQAQAGYLKHAYPLALETWRTRPPGRRFLANLCRLASPLL